MEKDAELCSEHIVDHAQDMPKLLGALSLCGRGDLSLNLKVEIIFREIEKAVQIGGQGHNIF